MENRRGMLYPIMIIAAISVIVFSVMGIATMTGWLPSALSQKDEAVTAQDQPTADKRALTQDEIRPGPQPPQYTSSQPAASAPQAQAQPKPVPRPRPAPEPREAPAYKAPVASVCANCGVIESIQAQEAKGEGTGLGAVVGGVAGAVLGHQVGSGRGRDAATVLGAVGGGYAGHEIEKNARKTVTYVIRVRMEDGTYRTVTQSTAPGHAVGERVKIVNGAIVGQG